MSDEPSTMPPAPAPPPRPRPGKIVGFELTFWGLAIIFGFGMVVLGGLGGVAWGIWRLLGGG